MQEGEDDFLLDYHVEWTMMPVSLQLVSRLTSYAGANPIQAGAWQVRRQVKDYRRILEEGLSPAHECTLKKCGGGPQKR